MLYFNQKGATQIFLVLILIIGLIAGVYLVQHPGIFKSRAYESGEVNFINDAKKTFPNNTTSNKFVHLEIKPPAWQKEVIDPEKYEYPVLFRVSFDQSKMDSEADCEITGDPLTNCQEVMLEKPTDTTYLSWVLPQKAGTYQINVRFFSKNLNTKDLASSITYKDNAEIGFEVPTALVGIQSFLTTIFDVFKKVPATSAINATTVFLSHVYTAGEEVITLSQAQQLGFNVDFSVAEDGGIEFLYDEDQLSKLNIALEFYPQKDDITEEPKLVILPKSNPSEQEDTIQATLEIALGETGGRAMGGLVNRGIVKATRKIKAIKSEIKVPQEEVNPAVPRVISREMTGSFKRILGLNVKNIARMNNAELARYLKLQSLLQTGEAYPVDPSVTRSIMERLIQNVEGAYGKTGLSKLNKTAIMATTDNNWVIAVPRYQLARLFPDAPHGFAANRLVVLADDYINEYTLTHEFVHVISSNTRLYGGKEVLPIGAYFRYDQNQADVYGATMSQIYELFTDQVVGVFTKIDAKYGYRYKFPQLSRSLTGFIDDVIKATGYKITYADFSVFALTGNDRQLMKKLIDDGIQPTDFMRILGKNIDGPRLAAIMRDYMAGAVQANVVKDKSWLVPAGAAGGTVVFLTTFFAANAKGEELPSDTTIIYEALNHDVDIGVTNTSTEIQTGSSPVPAATPQTTGCKQSYPQCAGTAGLENQPQGHTILVTPVCDDSGNITNYKKDDLGDKGECAKTQATPQKCDDQYYFDTAYDTCVHKFSGDPYPNCNYVFDRVERNLCP